MDKFDFSIISGEKSPRQAYRTHVPGLTAIVRETNATYEIKDISALGMGLKDVKNQFSLDDEFICDILLQGKPLAPKVKARVVRVLDNGVVGCNFVDLDPRKEARLDKLILEVQKRIIKLKRAKPADSD